MRKWDIGEEELGKRFGGKRSMFSCLRRRRGRLERRNRPGIWESIGGRGKERIEGRMEDGVLGDD
jgi:hypothetical protein